MRASTHERKRFSKSENIHKRSTTTLTRSKSDRTRVRKGNRRSKSGARPETKRKRSFQKRFLDDWIQEDDDFEAEDDELIPPPFPRKLLNLKNDPPSSPTELQAPSTLSTRSKSFTEISRMARSRPKKFESVFHSIPEPFKRSPEILEKKSAFKPQRNPGASIFQSGSRKRGGERTRAKTLAEADMKRTVENSFQSRQKQPRRRQPRPRYHSSAQRSESSDSYLASSRLKRRLRDDSPDTITTVTTSDMDITLDSFDRTVIGTLKRRYSFANVYQCQRGSIVFKLAFHSSPFTSVGEDVLSNAKSLFHFAILSIKYEGFECSLLEPIRKLNVKRTYSDFSDLRLEITNFHDGTLSGRFTGIIKNFNSGDVSRKVHIPLDIQFHCIVPSIENEKMSAFMNDPALDLVE